MAGDITAQEIRLILKMKRDKIVDLLTKIDAIPLRNGLNRWDVISIEDLHRLQHESDRVTLAEYGKLILDVVLSQSDEDVLMFLKFTHDKSNNATDIYDFIHKNKGKLKEIGEHVKEVYKKCNYHKVKTIPGEDFHLDLTKPEYLMQMEFHTQRLERDLISPDILPQDKAKRRYKSIQFDSVIDVIKSLKGSEASSVMCLGIAGSGKSIMMRNILCSWFQDDPRLQGFRFVMNIPLRDVNANSPLVDILCQVGESEGLITAEFKSDLAILLAESWLSEDILLLFDGIDEVELFPDSDLYKIISGEKFRNIKKVFTARPHSKLISILDKKQINQDYRVDVKGITMEEGQKYLRSIIKSAFNDAFKTYGIKTNESVEDIVIQFSQNIPNYPSVHMPLYLTLLAFLSNNHYAEYCSFADFKIPKSTTNLYNAYMKVRLRIWLKRLNPIESLKFIFDTNPLATTSSLPDDFKRLLLMIGKLSYDCLIGQKYSFTVKDLGKYLITKDDIIHSGLFLVTNTGGFEFDHHTLHAYLAAIYLSQVKFGEHSFTQILENQKHSLQKQNILSLFTNLEVVLCFVFGMNPAFASDIINFLGPHVGIRKFCYSNIESDSDDEDEDDADNEKRDEKQDDGNDENTADSINNDDKNDHDEKRDVGDDDISTKNDDADDNSSMNNDNDDAEDHTEHVDEEFVGLRIDLTYEAALFNEIDDQELKHTFLDFLARCDIVETGQSLDGSLNKIFMLCQAFSKNQRVDFLNRWFEFNVKEINGSSIISNVMRVNACSDLHLPMEVIDSNTSPFYDHQNMVEGYMERIDHDDGHHLSDQHYGVEHMDVEPSQEDLNDKLYIEELCSVLYCLLSPLSFPHIYKLEIDKSHISNVNLILRIFPNIKYLSIEGIDVPVHHIYGCGRDEEILISLVKSGTSHWRFDYPLSVSLTDEQASISRGPSKLTHIVLKGANNHDNEEQLYDESITALNNQKQLESIRMSGVDIFSNASDNERGSISWSHLNTLELFTDRLESAQDNKNVDNISKLIGKYIRNLKCLTLGIFDIAGESLTTLSNALLDHLIKEPPTDLKLLRLFNVLDLEGIRTLCDILPNLKALNTFGMDSGDVDKFKLDIVVQRCPNITDIHVGHLFGVERTVDPINVVKTLAATLRTNSSHNANRGIKVQMYEYSQFVISRPYVSISDQKQ